MKVIVVTGAGQGIGKETVRQLAAKGHRTILTARREAQLKAAQEEFQKMGLQTDTFCVDTNDDASVQNLAAYIEKKYGKLDVLVNNAGVFIDGDDKNRSTLEDIRLTFENNTLGPYRMIAALSPLLKKSGDARIVNVSSGMGALGEMNGGYPAYRISKTALNAVTRIFANDLSADKVRVNSVCPGFVKTAMGGKNATREVAQGAETIVWLATADDIPNGKFLRDKKEIGW